MKLFTFNKKWKNRDVIMFLERLEMYVSSGLTIDGALRISAEGSSVKQRKAIQETLRLVESGCPISRAISTSIGLSDTVAGLVEHGESGGRLVEAFGGAKFLMERQEELSKKCLSALIYPVVIGVFSLLLTLGLVRGVMPQIIPMLKSLNVELPVLTRIVVFVSETLISKGIHIFAVIFITIIFGLILYRKCYIVKNCFHRLIIHIPIVGRLIYTYSLSVFLRSCGVLIESGKPVAWSYKNTIKTISLLPLKNLLQSKQNDIEKGISLGNVLAQKMIPGYVSSLLIAGESSGNLGTSASRAASILDRDIEYSLKSLTSLIEPVMMVGIGCIVGAIALAIMMPIYDISKVLQR